MSYPRSVIVNHTRNRPHMCFLLADENGRLEVNVDDNQQLVVTRLEEQMFDIAEQDICDSAASMINNI